MKLPDSLIRFVNYIEGTDISEAPEVREPSPHKARRRKKVPVIAKEDKISRCPLFTDILTEESGEMDSRSRILRDIDKMISG